MDKSLLKWAVQEFGYVPVDENNPDGLRKLVSGDMRPYWSYVVKHVKSEECTRVVKGNLRLAHHRKLQQEPSEPSLSLSMFEDQTLTEREMLLKELKDLNFRSKKCREKTAKVQAEVSQGLKEQRVLRSSLDDAENRVDSQFKHLTFLDSVLDSYADPGSGKLQQLTAAGQSLRSYLAGLRPSGEVKPRKPSFEKVYGHCYGAIKAAATTAPQKPLTQPDPADVSACFRECDNNPVILVEAVTQKCRDISKHAIHKVEFKGPEVVSTTSAETVFQEWRRAHVLAMRKAVALDKEMTEQEKLARMAGDRAKEALQETDVSPEQRSALLKLVGLNEKRARLDAAITEIRDNLTREETKGAEDMTAKQAKIESLKTTIVNCQKNIKALNQRNEGFQEKISKVQQGAKSASKEVSELAREIDQELTSLNPKLLANRLSNFKLSAGHSTINVPSDPRHKCDGNAAVFLTKLAEDKNEDFVLSEFLKWANDFDSSKSGHKSAFQWVLQHARTDPLPDIISQLNLVLERMASLK